MKSTNQLQNVQFIILYKYKDDLIKLQSLFNEYKHLRAIIKKVSNNQINKIK
jgi:hypothetical protein